MGCCRCATGACRSCACSRRGGCSSSCNSHACKFRERGKAADGKKQALHESGPDSQVQASALELKLNSQGYAHFANLSIKIPQVMFEQFKQALQHGFRQRWGKHDAPELDVWRAVAEEAYREVTVRQSTIDLSFFHLEPMMAQLYKWMDSDKVHSDLKVLMQGFEIVNAGFFVAPPQDDGPPQELHRDMKLSFKQTTAERVTIVVALTESARANGGTRFVPGSHINSRLNSDSPAVYPTLKPGEGVIFNFNILHAGGKNSTPSPRVLMYVVAQRPGLKKVDLNIAQMQNKSPLVLAHRGDRDRGNFKFVFPE
jgi:hypothetical protein